MKSRRNTPSKHYSDFCAGLESCRCLIVEVAYSECFDYVIFVSAAGYHR